MPCRLPSLLTSIVLGCLLAGCSDPAEQTPARAAQAGTVVAGDSIPLPPPVSGPSIRLLMNTDVAPHAMTLWQAVRYVATADGVVEDVAPKTPADWQTLADSAFALIAAGEVLLKDGLLADAAAPDGDYKFTGPEIQALLDANPDGWRYYVEQMQFATNATLEAIVRRDIIGLMESGATINNACNGCHAEFWYRPLE
jgi:hypothetical protein